MSNVVREVDESLDLLKETKSNIRSAIEQKGVTVSDTDTFASYASKIEEISSTSINNQDKTITENGQYTADEGYTGLGTVTVNVPSEEDVVEAVALGNEVNAAEGDKVVLNPIDFVLPDSITAPTGSYYNSSYASASWDPDSNNTLVTTFCLTCNSNTTYDSPFISLRNESGIFQNPVASSIYGGKKIMQNGLCYMHDPRNAQLTLGYPTKDGSFSSVKTVTASSSSRMYATGPYIFDLIVFSLLLYYNNSDSITTISLDSHGYSNSYIFGVFLFNDEYYALRHFYNTYNNNKTTVWKLNGTTEDSEFTISGLTSSSRIISITPELIYDATTDQIFKISLSGTAFTFIPQTEINQTIQGLYLINGAYIPSENVGRLFKADSSGNNMLYTFQGSELVASAPVFEDPVPENRVGHSAGIDLFDKIAAYVCTSTSGRDNYFTEIKSFEGIYPYQYAAQDKSAPIKGPSSLTGFVKSNEGQDAFGNTILKVSTVTDPNAEPWSDVGKLYGFNVNVEAGSNE